MWAFLRSILKFPMKPEPPSADELRCPICHGDQFNQTPVLWPRLIEQWQLDPDEAMYMDRQQGYLCGNCKSNLRSMTLASAVLAHFCENGPFKDFCIRSKAAKHMRILEINEAGNLHPFLKNFKHHFLASYPQVDMQDLPFSDECWDIIIHSDVLEHVPNPAKALKECYRVLKPNGVMFFTIPVVYGRVTRRRDLHEPPSYHGASGSESPDLYVYSEYGADFWVELLKAGFLTVSIHQLSGPESVAAICQKSCPITCDGEFRERSHSPR